MLDLVIRGGTVVDGSGSDPFLADVGITGDRIGHIGASCPPGRREIDAAGLYVTPGFIDIHSHSDYTLLVDPRAVSALYQGVTLEVVGNCGHGCFPIVDPDLATKAIYGYSDAVPITWNSAEGYLARLEWASPALNVLTMVPHGQLRLSTVGLTDRATTDRELMEMSRLLEQALEEGAWGLSTGLEYATEAGAGEREISELCRSLDPRDHLYVCHTRIRDSGAPTGVEEAIRTARTAGVRLQVSHLVPRSGDRETEECLRLVEEAHRSGMDIAFDMHTRLFGFTYLYSVLPPWAMSDGQESLAAHLGDPVSRQRMKGFRSILGAGNDWQRIVLLDTDQYPEYSRRTIQSIADERGQEPLETVFDLLRDSLDSMASLMALIDCHTEQQQILAFGHSLSMPASDATTTAPDGPLADVVFHGAYTWAAYFYNFAVKRFGFLTPSQAVNRLSGAPAKRLGLVDRGLIKKGHHADITILDHDAFSEAGTRFEPNRLARGVVHVLVNGTPVVVDGDLSRERPGRVLRR